VAAADPQVVTRQAAMQLDELDLPIWVIAIGKGAHGMASGAVAALRDRRVTVAGGLVVAHEPDESATHGLEAIEGDHPTPARRSFAAADRISDLASRTTGDADALVLVSGGTTSLIAAPVPPISEQDLQEAFAALLGSGADIGLMNAARKRLLRFGAGRLALALGTRRVHCLIASDVVGNDLSSIASGPCVPDRVTAKETRERLRETGAWDGLPKTVQHLLDDMVEGRAPDVPAADHPRFTTTSATVILDRTHAERGAAEKAQRSGVTVVVRTEPLSGDAATAGREFVRTLARHEEPRCVIWSGETTVTLGGAAGRGGRCQEFALACAIELEAANAPGITILAAGTDGRDGPTDAAGAIVDAKTCERIRAGGVNPVHALSTHSSYDALSTADALLKTGPTGTNVNDLVIGFLQ
jgi:hydroxypyruvate reductase